MTSDEVLKDILNVAKGIARKQAAEGGDNDLIDSDVLFAAWSKGKSKAEIEVGRYWLLEFRAWLTENKKLRV